MKLKTILLVLCAGLLAFTSCKKDPTAIELSASKTTIEIGEVLQIDVVYTPSNAKSDLIWVSKNPTVATVDQNGKVTGVANGIAKIEVSTSNFLDAFINITVSDGAVVITDGDGTQTSPYSVAQAIGFTGAASTVNGWVGGYIVGGIIDDGNVITSLSTNPEGAIFGNTGVRSTAVFIADSPNETNLDNIVIVKLNDAANNPAAMRGALNLVDNCSNYKTYIKVTGAIYRYFGVPGIREITDYEGGGLGCPLPEGAYNLLDQSVFNQFTAVSVAGTEAWVYDASYGAKMSGYSDGASHANEDWFISPVVNLDGSSSATLSFSHARGPAGSITVGVTEGWYQVYVTSNYTGNVGTTTWTELAGVNHGTTGWAFVDSGSLSIPAAACTANTRFAFRYRCSDAASATWEIKNITLQP